MEAAELGVTELPQDYLEFDLFETERLLPVDRHFNICVMGRSSVLMLNSDMLMANLMKQRDSTLLS